MENKKKSTGWIVITILLLLVIAGLVLVILNDKGIIKIGNTTKSEIKEEKKEKTKVKDKTKNDNNKDTVDESKIIYSGEGLGEDKDFGKVTFGGKEIDIKYSKNEGAYQEGRLYIGDKYLDFLNFSLSNIAIMGDYLVVGINQDGYRFELYNYDLKQVDKVGNSLGILMAGTKTNTDKLLIDENDLIYYQCDVDYNNKDKDVLNIYNLKIDGSSIEKILISTNPNVACVSQR